MTQNALELGGPLQLRIWTTRGCYFVLSDRLKRKSRYSVGATTVIAFYIFIIALMLMAFGNGASEDILQAFNTFSIILSVFLIIITLLEVSKRYDVESHSALNVAHQLERLYNEYELYLIIYDGNESYIEEHARIRRRYAEILYEANVNRKEVDYHVFQLKNAEELNIHSWRRVAIFLAMIFEMALEYWLYAVMILVPPLMIARLLWQLEWQAVQ